MHAAWADTRMWAAGEDGFYDFDQCNADVNPSGWAGQTGQNFLPNHAVSVSGTSSSLATSKRALPLLSRTPFLLLSPCFSSL